MNPDSPPASAARERIVVVDDDRLIRELVCEVVARTLPRARLAQYNSATLAYRHIVSAGADLLITDCHMLDMDGPTLVRALRRDGLSLPIIMVSGSADAQRDGEAAGIDRFVPKDLLNTALSAALLALLHSAAEG